MYLSIDRFHFIRLPVELCCTNFSENRFHTSFYIYHEIITIKLILINNRISISKSIVSFDSLELSRQDLIPNFIDTCYPVLLSLSKFWKDFGENPTKKIDKYTHFLDSTTVSIRESTRTPFHFKRTPDKLICHCHGSRHAHNLTVYHEPHTCVCIVMRRHRVAATRNGHDESQSATGINPGAAIYQPGLSPFPS